MTTPTPTPTPTPALAATPAPAAAADPDRWLRRARQVRAVFGLEFKKTLLRPRVLLALAGAFLPAVMLGLRALHQAVAGEEATPAPQLAATYGTIFQTLYLRLILFFGCAGLFVYQFRGEILERSLHFYLLAPIERGALLAGKYLAGLAAACGFFVTSTLAQLLLAFLPAATQGGAEYLVDGPGFGHAWAYLGITLLACVGYGSVFLYFGLLARNPMLPVAAVLGWEMLNAFLPPSLQWISVIHHLQALCPVPISRGPFALPADPAPPWLAILGLLAVSAGLLVLSLRRVRDLEISYTGD